MLMTASSERTITLLRMVAWLALSIPSAPIAAQVTRDSSGRASAPAADSTAAAYGDSVSKVGVDTSHNAQAADTIRPILRDSVSPASASTTPSIPVDTVLSAACPSGQPGTLASGLLLVVFRDEVTTEDRLTAVREAGGSPVGPAPVGGEYVRAQGTASARDIADQLALNPVVASVSERSCPSAGRR